MIINETDLPGVYVIDNFSSKDCRGSFTKTYVESEFVSRDLCSSFKESYFSVSNKDVIRGMHFQKPPHDHDKLVYVASGAIVDVVLDLRKKSPTFGKYISVELTYDNAKSIYIPAGFAHGFKSMIDNTITVYNVSTEYNREADCGIRWNSFGFNWEIDAPVISDRDSAFIAFREFSSSFE